MQKLKIIPKILFVLVVFFAVLTVFVSSISHDAANRSGYNAIKAQRAIIYKNINNPEFQKDTAGRSRVKSYRIAMCKIMGEGCTDNPDDGDKNYRNSLVGGMTGMIVYPFSHKPASGVSYVFDSLSNHGLVPQQAYAVEGVGFASLKPITGIWKLFRDISYLILVLIIIFIGFMIMFRMKLNPQTAISIENTLPRIIITLIFITFSFAIAGFLIDLMYVFMGVGVSLVSKNQTLANGSVINDIYGSNVWDLFNSTAYAHGNIFRTGDAILNLFPQFIENSIRTIVGFLTIILTNRMPVIGNLFSGDFLKDVLETGGLLKFVVQLITTGIIGAAGSILAGKILSLLIWFTALSVFIRIFFALFFNYIQIIVLTIFAPIILLFGAIPGKHTFGFWFKNLAANLLTFPLVAILIIVANMIVNLPITDGYMWQPPMMSSTDTRDGAFNILVGIGVLYMIPNLMKMVKKALGAEGLPGAGLGLFFGGATVAGGSILGVAGQASGIFYAKQTLDMFTGKAARDKAKELRERSAQNPDPAPATVAGQTRP